MAHNANVPRPNHFFLRLAVTVICGLLCTLFTVLWVRSYSLPVPNFTLGGHTTNTYQGRIYVDGSMTMVEMEGAMWLVPTGKGIRIPLWLLTLLVGVSAATSWLPYRFSLRTLLIATTLAAVGLGLIMRIVLR